MAQPQGMTPMVSFNQLHPLVDENSSLPMVSIYATGEVIVNRDADQLRPGQYQWTLDTEELQMIKQLAWLVGPYSVNQEQLVAQSADINPLRVSSDPTTSLLTFNRVSGANTLSAGDGTTADTVQTIMIDDPAMSSSTALDSEAVAALRKLHVRMVDLFSAAGS